MDALDNARDAIVAAVRAGKLLAEEKDAFIAAEGRGKWIFHCDAVFGKLMTPKQAVAWMALATKSDSGDGPVTNILRQGLLALDIMPTKERTASAGANSRLAITASHFIAIHRFVVWFRGFAKTTTPSDLSPAERDQLRSDFAPIIKFLRDYKLME